MFQNVFNALRSILARWFGFAPALPDTPPAEGEQGGSVTSNAHDADLADASTGTLVPYDENLLERARTQWQFGDWESLVQLNRDTLQHHPDSAKLALLAAAGRLQTGLETEAKVYIRLAQDLGVSKKLISQILIADVHNSIGRAAAIGNQQHRALQHFENAISIGTPGADAKLLTQARISGQLQQIGSPGSSAVPTIGVRSGEVLRGETPIRVIENNGLTRTFETGFGKVTLYANETYITPVFNDGLYWDIDNLRTVSQYVDPKKNILEIGGHCGTSSLVYASLLAEGSVIYVFEPQQRLFELLLHNVRQNSLEGIIIPIHSAVFCYDGELCMNDVDIDGGGGNPEKRYTTESSMPCNFGGIGIGGHGEKVRVTTVDSIPFLSNIGFMHVDAQGAEPFIFSRSTRTLRGYRPVVFFEDNMTGGPELYGHVKSSFPQFEEFSSFNIERYCVDELGYRRVIHLPLGIDVLLVP
ncbi:MAG: FkbM family methyltransferase [Clostridia bacterium]|nr:FkbM family methyltransferase [Clostridia bacterium]